MFGGITPGPGANTCPIGCSTYYLTSHRGSSKRYANECRSRETLPKQVSILTIQRVERLQRRAHCTLYDATHRIERCSTRALCLYRASRAALP